MCDKVSETQLTSRDISPKPIQGSSDFPSVCQNILYVSVKGILGELLPFLRRDIIFRKSRKSDDRSAVVYGEVGDDDGVRDVR